MITDKAIDAAWATMWDVPGVPRCNATREEVRLALEAAAPHLTGAAWEEGYGHGYKHGYADCLKLHGHETREEA